ncbi:MAG: NAD(P)-dependent oxidoreductase [Promethearchaeota archaeon]|jgi:phosphoglycerate dehydrogenase-like enzyme
MKVLVVRPYLSDWIARQKDLLPNDVELITPEKGTEEELIQLARDVEIIVCTHLSDIVVENAKNLKLIQKTGAGVDALPFDAIGDDVFVANTSGANPVPLAEGAISLLLALARRVVQRNNLFPKIDRHRGTELRGKKVGIIGLGNIGIEIAKRLQAFEMKILALKRRKSEELKRRMNLEFLGGPEDLDYILSESDFIVVIVPLTPATRGMIGERELKLMKPSAYLINVARAAIIEEKALYFALKENRIAGAALDVWWIPHWWDPKWKPELDKPSRYPIWELPNVIATPHNIGFADYTIFSENPLRIIAENIRNIANGKPPINQVDKEHQY